MNFNKHYDLAGQHALFSASQNAWLNYSKEKAIEKYLSRFRTRIGTELHEFAASQIQMSIKHSSIKGMLSSAKSYIYSKYERLEEDEVSYGIELIKAMSYLPKEVFENLRRYINDSIGYRMIPEQVLYYSNNFFGTTDAISFRDDILRIHDLKTGAIPAHMQQLEIYTALFCLEYSIKPEDIHAELRIYQNEEVLIHEPTVDDILPIMNKIVKLDKEITKLKAEEN